MTFEPMTWSWPQWTIVILLFLSLLLNAGQHGKPRVDAKTGEPETHSFPLATCRLLLWGFVLTAGGFFGGAQ